MAEVKSFIRTLNAAGTFGDSTKIAVRGSMIFLRDSPAAVLVRARRVEIGEREGATTNEIRMSAGEKVIRPESFDQVEIINESSTQIKIEVLIGDGDFQRENKITVSGSGISLTLPTYNWNGFDFPADPARLELIIRLSSRAPAYTLPNIRVNGATDVRKLNFEVLFGNFGAEDENTCPLFPGDEIRLNYNGPFKIFDYDNVLSTHPDFIYIGAVK